MHKVSMLDDPKRHANCADLCKVDEISNPEAEHTENKVLNCVKGTFSMAAASGQASWLMHGFRYVVDGRRAQLACQAEESGDSHIVCFVVSRSR